MSAVPVRLHPTAAVAAAEAALPSMRRNIIQENMKGSVPETMSMREKAGLQAMIEKGLFAPSGVPYFHGE